MSNRCCLFPNNSLLNSCYCFNSYNHEFGFIALNHIKVALNVRLDAVANNGNCVLQAE